jgi:mono/diheme cytochrome c family protein
MIPTRFKGWSYAFLISAAGLIGLTASFTAQHPAQAASPATAPSVAPDKVDFARDIQPIFQSRCYDCHGATKQKGGLRLDQPTALKGGDSNEPLFLAHQPEKSHILKLIRGDDPEEIMPPKGKDRLTAAQIETLTQWVKQGGQWSQGSVADVKGKQTHWSFNPPKRPAVPQVKNGVVRNPIDNFILARLEKEGLKQSPEADRYALIRRVTFDLTGLPPKLEEVDAFVNDKSPNAYEKLVDRLLASPKFGERWARPWLDLARYADSAGYGSDPLRFTIHPYRDWVIKAFNENKPYDVFTIEQLAGDLLPSTAGPNPTQDQLVATGFHRNTMTNTEGGTDDEEFRVAAVKDRAEVTAQVWMGLTLGCAQCHTHKFDPITNREYYQMFAIFNQTEDSDKADESPKLPTPTKEQVEQQAKLNAEIAKLETEINGNPRIAEGQAKWEKSLPADPEAIWQPLKTEKTSSEGGATLESRPDGSILVSGTLPKTDTYTLEATSDLKGITAFRIEALPDESLPAKGPGRAGNGSFILNEFRVSAVPLTEKQPATSQFSGRFVRIEVPGPKQILALAEVQVFAGENNLALKGKAKQSSTDYGGDAAKAIDGNTDGDFRKAASTSHTAKSTNPWWEVDLGGEKQFERIAIWNRTDEGLGDRLVNFKVSVLNAAHEVVWSEMVAKPPAPSLTLKSGKTSDVALANATATWEQPDGAGWAAAKAIDGDTKPTSGWAILPKVGMRHAAVFEAANPVGFAGGTRLTLKLIQNFETGSLGHFRISVTTAAKPVRVLPMDVSDALAVAAEKRSDAQKQSIRDHYLKISPEIKADHAKVESLRKQLAGMKMQETAILRELPANKRRQSNMLVKGNFLNKGETVEPKVLAAFNPPPSDGPVDRLGLAKWIVSKENPLTARVEVNRIWSQFFGTGIVETQEDFGEQGQPPSHPELLDWLAVEFMEPTSGAGAPTGDRPTAWDVKRLMRLIVTSATYRQSAKVTVEQLEKDSRNHLLARMPRQRLEAEMVRDQALASAGLLSGKMFGPSVYPPQPDGLWQAAFNGQRTYPTSSGEDRYRRGLYTFWRRTVPYPSMQTFDAPSREVCTIRRISTCTPLQAFVTMNDPVYVECSQALGRRMMAEGGETIESRIRFGLRLVQQRPPTDGQVAALVKLYKDEQERFAASTDDAKKLAGAIPAKTDPAEAAAWTMVANVLLNTDAAMTR